MDVVIANGENAAAGRGITKSIFQSLLHMGVDVVTMGNHTWDQKEIMDFIDDTDYLIRPANFSEDAPGKGMTSISKGGHTISVINMHGRTFLPPHDDPFKMATKMVEEAKKLSPIVFVDFHAEATSEKIAFGWHLDGNASVVVGTHTHVQTADSRILPGGTAYITDVGMTGPYDGVLGMKKKMYSTVFKRICPLVLKYLRLDVLYSGFFVEVDNSTGKAIHQERIYINEDYPFKG